MKNEIFVLGTLTAALVLAGCSSPAVTQQIKAQADKSSHATAALNDALPIQGSTPGHHASTNAAARAQAAPVVAKRASRPWIGSEMIEVNSEDTLPPIFDETFDAISFDDSATNGKVTLAVFADRMSRITGVPFRIKQDVYELPQAQTLSGAARGPVGTPATAATKIAGVSVPAPLAVGQPVAPGNPGNVYRSQAAPQLEMDLVEMRWKKATPRAITDFVTGRLGLSSSYRDGVLIIERFVTETFEIPTLEGEKQFRMNLQGGSTSGSGDNGGASNTSDSNFRVEESGLLDSFDSMVNSLRQMVSAVPGSSVTVNQATGRFYVTSTKEAMQRIRQIIKTERQSMLRQVRIQFDIYTVTSKDGDQKGVNWGAVLNSLSSKWRATVDSPTSLVNSDAGQFGMTVLGLGNGGNPASGTVARWGNTQAAVQALNETGMTVQLRQLELQALNRQWARKTNLDEETYVSETTPSAASFAGAGMVGMKTKTLVTGDKYIVQPAILDDGTVLMRFGISMANLISMTETTSGQGETMARVNRPKRNGVEDQSMVALKAGQVMVITGMGRNKAKQTERRLAQGWSLLTGGSNTDELEREEFMIVVRPVLMN